MNTTASDSKDRSMGTTTATSRRLGIVRAAAIAALSALAVAGAGASLPAHGGVKPSSGYTQIDTSDHPTNPAACRTRWGC